MKTVFVQIASYRDPECQWTVKDLFAKARHPDRITVGICWQYDPEKDKNCFNLAAERPDQVRVTPFHWSESEGVCWARHHAQKLWDGEDYILSIDSHARFAHQWDELLIEQLSLCRAKKPVLSNYPACYAPPEHLQPNPMPTIMRAHLYTPQGDLHFRGIEMSRAPKKPLRGAFCTSRFLFACGDVAHDIPGDPYLYCDQEEVALSARLYTHGYDVFSASGVFLYHYYRDSVSASAKHPPKHQNENAGWLRLQERGRKRLSHLLRIRETENPEIIRDIEHYGLGQERTLDEYETFCGVNFRQHTVSERALRCGFIENLGRYLDKAIHIPEIDDVPAAIAAAPAPVMAPQVSKVPVFNQPAAIERLVRAHPKGQKLDIDREAPEGVLIIYDLIDRKTCRKLTDYADSQSYTDLEVVDSGKSTQEKIVSFKDEGRITHHVDIDGMAFEIINIFNDIHANYLCPFYNVGFEWYERPQILRYPPGGKYNQHSDADQWLAESDQWIRVQDRDQTALIYLNDDYEGGEIQFTLQNVTIKPRTGMLLAFPSDHRYQHAALPTRSGIRYAIVAWSAVTGSKRVRKQMPYGSVYIRQKRLAK